MSNESDVSARTANDSMAVREKVAQSPLAPSPLYIGLSEKSKRWIIGIAALIATANLALAWVFAFQARASLTVSGDDFKPYEKWAQQSQSSVTSEAMKFDLAARPLHLIALTKTIANKQGVVLACFGAAFAMASLGFALFVLGADGAFSLTAQAPTRGSVVLSGTAPGLFCFLLATVLVAVGVTREAKISLPSFPIYGASFSGSPGVQPIASCSALNPVTNSCEPTDKP